MSEAFIGEIRLFGFGRTPAGWQACDGSVLQIAQYDALFSLIGTTYGGDGQTTFAVPDLRGRVPVHQGQGDGLSPYALGQKGGSEEVTLQVAHLPAHSHTVIATTTAAAATTANPTLLPGAVSGDALYATDITGLSPSQQPATVVSLSAGGSQPHENTMPTLTAQFCIALDGIYPQQN